MEGTSPATLARIKSLSKRYGQGRVQITSRFSQTLHNEKPHN